MQNPEMPCQIIEKIQIVHCARGPQRCEKCKAVEANKWALLNICPDNPGMVARRVTEFTWQGEKLWVEFEVEKVFESKQEARAWSKEHGVIWVGK
ncbi:MAG: hypothetical protein H6581_11165 [Bacteroidia bacterium]|nr:hypothetical protein [Bacteroidia bacterium]